MAKLINGNGNPAIYAAEDADLIASLAGNVTCIANVGNKYAATEEDATTIRLDDGVIITKEGRRIQLEAGESDTFYIPTGTSGQTNYYIIGYKLVQNADSTQVAEQFVQKMNSSSETITEDTFRSGATEVYVSVYRVTQVGFTIDSISGLLPELLDNASIKDNIDQINSDITPVHGSLTFDGNWGGSNFQLRKVGKQVSLYFMYQTGKNTNFTSDKVATLPEGFRPSVAIYMPTVKFDSSGLVPTGHGYVVCTSNGNVRYYGDAFAFTEYIYVNGSFVMN